jgi:hypothetical protein
MNLIKRWPIWFAVAGPLVFSGCLVGNNRDLSTLQPYQGFTGRTVPLRRPVYVIYYEDETPHYTFSDYPLYSTVFYGERRQDFVDFGVCRLPAEHPVHIERVRLKMHFENGAIYQALGRTFLPGKDVEVSFFYFWGSNGYLRRAPWETEDVPERRVVSRDGKLQ